MFGREFDITYLPKSKFLLSLAPCADPQNNRTDKQFLKTVHALFGAYTENTDMADDAGEKVDANK